MGLRADDVDGEPVNLDDQVRDNEFEDDAPELPAVLKVDAEVCEALPIADAALFADEERPPVAWFVGAHGGAGASTLGRLCAPMEDADKQWPAHDALPLCVVVCRSTRSGLDAAQSAILQAKSGNAGACTVLGVVIVADAPGKTPKVLRQREKVLEDLTTIWRIPYLAEIRETTPDSLAVWEPFKPEDKTRRRRRRQKKQPMTDSVHPALATVAQTIFNEAYKVFKEKEKEQ